MFFWKMNLSSNTLILRTNCLTTFSISIYVANDIRNSGPFDPLHISPLTKTHVVTLFLLSIGLVMEIALG